MEKSWAKTRIATKERQGVLKYTSFNLVPKFLNPENEVVP